jgi:hypothetical protein
MNSSSLEKKNVFLCREKSRNKSTRTADGYGCSALRLWRSRDLFIAQGGHGVEATGAERGDVAGGTSDEGECGSSKTQC